MKNPHKTFLRFRRQRLATAFTLAETVIAIGVLAILLTGFIAVFTPAAQGIRRAITAAQADRLSSTLEMELVTSRVGQHTPPGPATGFDKAFKWLQESDTSATAIFVYQYRGDPRDLRADETPRPLYVGPVNVAFPGRKPNIGEPGKDYIVQSMARRLDDIMLVDDLRAIEGAVFFVKPTQFHYGVGGMILGLPGEIKNTDGSVAISATDYNESVLAFSAEFHTVPSKTIAYLRSTSFTAHFNNNSNRPTFTRNLAVRR